MSHHTVLAAALPLLIYCNPWNPALFPIFICDCNLVIHFWMRNLSGRLGAICHWQKYGQFSWSYTFFCLAYRVFLWSAVVWGTGCECLQRFVAEILLKASLQPLCLLLVTCLLSVHRWKDCGDVGWMFTNVTFAVALKMSAANSCMVFRQPRSSIGTVAEKNSIAGWKSS